MEFQTALLTLLLFFRNAFALPQSQPVVVTNRGSSVVDVVYEFPNITWVENLAVRNNGKVLVTLFNTPELWQIDPITHAAEFIYQFPDALGATGIAEVAPDVFAVAVGNFSVASPKIPLASYSVWSIDLSKGEAEIHKITDIPGALVLNGMTVLPTQPDTVLVGDSGRGVIWYLDTKTGEYHIAIDNPDLKPNASAAFEVGVNGIRYRDGYVYFVNTFNTAAYSRIPISSNGFASGPVEAISSNFATPDDFALDKQGNAWITTDPSNGLVKVTLEGEVSVIAGGVNESVLLGPTSAAFGRTRKDRDVLYITANGGILTPPPTGAEPGRLYSIDTSKW